MVRVQRRDFLIAAGALLAAPLAAEARQAAKVPRIGYVATDLAAFPRLREAFLQGLRDLGYAERRNDAGTPEARFFFGDSAPRLDRPDLVVEVPHINRASVVELADRLQPDVIAVFGTSLIGGALLGKGRLGVANLHGGLSPCYRGADRTFWALYNGEPDQVGCTLHCIDAGIDSGKLIAHVCPSVKAGDDELTLFWRAVQDSSEAYAELLARLVRGERLDRAQPEQGRLYQVRQRGWRHKRDLSRRMRAGMLERVDLAPRLRWHAEDEGGGSGRGRRRGGASRMRKSTVAALVARTGRLSGGR